MTLRLASLASNCVQSRREIGPLFPYIHTIKNLPTVQYEVDSAPVEYLLNPEYAPNTVFYLWCGTQRSLQFHHYLNIMSVIKNMRPDNIIFMYRNLPALDQHIYNTFYSELKDNYPFFRAIPADKNACHHNYPSSEFVKQYLTKYGGWFMSPLTMVNAYTASLRNTSFINAYNKSTEQGFLMARTGYPGHYNVEDITSDPTIHATSLTCISVEQYNHWDFTDEPLCINNPNIFWPKDIIEKDDRFSQLCRRIFYGSAAIPSPTPDYNTLAPNIGHMIWVGHGRMDFLFFLGVLSLLYVAEVDCVYIHGDGPPTGPYWDKLKHHPRVKYVFRQPPKQVYGNLVTDLPHLSDVWRVDIMTRYGGLYIDTDSLVVRKFDEDSRAYDAIVSVDWPQWNVPYPVSVYTMYSKYLYPRVQLIITQH